MTDTSGPSINTLPQELVLELHTRYTPTQVNERITLINGFVEQNRSRLSDDFLQREVSGHRALVYYQAQQYVPALEQYRHSVAHSTPANMLYFHERNMVARCYRLCGQFTESETWILHSYEQKHLMADVFELLDLLAEYQDLLDDTQRVLPAVYLADLRQVIMETGMHIRLNEENPGEVLREMRALNKEENKKLSSIAIQLRNDAAGGKKALETFVAASRMRFYKETAEEWLRSF